MSSILPNTSAHCARRCLRFIQVAFRDANLQQVRCITVRAAKATAQQEQREQERIRPKNKQRDPYAPLADPNHTVAGPVPMDIQRAFAVFRRALLEGNAAVALANYRILSTGFLQAIKPSEFSSLIRLLAKPFMTHNQVPTSADMDILKAIFQDMMSHRSASSQAVPDDIYAKMIDACAKREDTEGMWDTWCQMHEDGVSASLATYNLVLKLFAKEGMIEKVEDVYSSLLHRPDLEPDVSTYFALVTARAAAADVDGALALTREWAAKGNRLSVRVLNPLLSAFKKDNNIEAMEQLWEHMQQNEIYPNNGTYNTMLDAYAKAGRLEDAHRVLRTMKEDASSGPSREHCAPDVVTYNITIDMFGKAKQVDAAVKLFNEMSSVCVYPDIVTYTAMMDAHRRQNDVEGVHKYFNLMENDPEVVRSPAPYNVLIATYGSQGNLVAAKNVYEDMLGKKVSPNRHTFRQLITAHEKAGDFAGAATWYQAMRRKKITPDVKCLVAVMRAYVHHSPSVRDALDTITFYFKEAEIHGRVGVSVCNQLLHAYLRSGLSVREAVSTIYEAEYRSRGIKPNAFTVGLLITTGALPEEQEMSFLDEQTAAAGPEQWKGVLEAAAARGAATPAPVDGGNHGHSTFAKSGVNDGGVTSAKDIALGLLGIVERCDRGESFSRVRDEGPGKENIMETRALLEVYRDMVSSNQWIKERLVTDLGKRVESLLGPISWQSELKSMSNPQGVSVRILKADGQMLDA